MNQNCQVPVLNLLWVGQSFWMYNFLSCIAAGIRITEM